MTEIKYPGLIIPNRCVKDAESKDFAQDNMSGWVYVELTADEWFEKLEQGAVIQPSRFNKKDGRWTHGSTPWVSTQWIFADGDHFKGVEFGTDPETGKRFDKSPNGVEATQEIKGVFDAFPDLAAHVFAAQESVNSMVEGRFEFPHYRWRLIFRLDEPVTTPEHYKQILERLGEKFPVISPDRRSPGQPVFGNAREGHSTVWTKGNVLKLSDYPYSPPKMKTLDDGSYDGPTLVEWMDEHSIQYTPDTKNPHFYRVPCPFSSGHTGGKDDGRAFLSDDGGKFAYYCPHSHCKDGGNNTFERFKEGMGIKSKVQDTGGKRKGSGRKSNAEKSKTAIPIETGRPVVFLNRIEETGDKPVYSDRPRFEVADEVANVVFDNTQSGGFYRRALELGTLRRDGETLKFKPYTLAGISGVISRAVSLQKYAEGSIVEIANPTKWVAEDILENQDITNLPAIRIILSHPYWGGEKIGLVSDIGFNTDIGVYLDRKANDLDLDLNKHSVEDDIAIWREWLQDFPFQNDADFENALAYMLTLIVRPGLPTGEVSPMFLITAPREGVGKTLLADVLTAAVTGIITETRTLSEKSGEIKKELGAALRAAPEVLIFDNVDPEKRMDSGFLASLVTQVRGAFRVLGASEEQTYENRVTTCYTGSNVQQTMELAKRSVMIELKDPGIAEKDRVVKVKNILNETLKQHNKFVSSLIRMVKRWTLAEKVALEPKHRMREWSEIIQGILTVNGLGDNFLENTNRMMLQAGDEFTIWANAYKAIVKKLEIKAFKGWITKDVFTILSYNDNVYSPGEGSTLQGIDGERGKTTVGIGDNLLGEYITEVKQRSRSIRLGKILNTKVGAVFGGLKLVDTHKHDPQGRKIYKMEKVD